MKSSFWIFYKRKSWWVVIYYLIHINAPLLKPWTRWILPECKLPNQTSYLIYTVLRSLFDFAIAFSVCSWFIRRIISLVSSIYFFYLQIVFMSCSISGSGGLLCKLKQTRPKLRFPLKIEINMRSFISICSLMSCYSVSMEYRY